jgi:hypothetical protein
MRAVIGADEACNDAYDAAVGARGQRGRGRGMPDGTSADAAAGNRLAHQSLDVKERPLCPPPSCPYRSSLHLGERSRDHTGDRG